jgi:delta(3,5)-delta(2,4)-dienoyl-CoA isomerase
MRHIFATYQTPSAPQPVIAAVHSIKVDVGLAADMGTLARVPKLVGNSSLSHELVLSVRTLGAEGAAVVWLLSSGVTGSQAEVARKSPVIVVGTTLSTISSRSSRMRRQQGKRPYNAERHGSNNNISFPAAFQQPRRFIAVDY